MTVSEFWNSEKEPIVDANLQLARDYPSIITWSMNKIPSLTEDWNDFTITDPGVLLISSISYLFDNLNYTLDKNLMNNILRYSKSFDSLLRMASMLGVEVPSAESSLTILKVSSLTGGITLPKDSIFKVKIRGLDREIFLNLTEEVELQVGDNTVSCIEGKKVEKVLDYDDFDLHNGILIEEENIAKNSFRLKTTVEWEEVDEAVLTIKESPSFSVNTTFGNKLYLKMCPGAQDYVPLSGIEVSYLVSSGKLGNLRKGLTDIVLEGHSELAIEVLESFGGSDRLDARSLRNTIEQNSNQVFTLVNDRDFERLGREINEVYRIVSRLSGGVREVYYQHNTLFSNQEVEDLLYNRIEDRVIAKTGLVLSEVNTRPISVSLSLHIKLNVSTSTELENEIKGVVEAEFSRANQFPGFRFNRIRLATRINDLYDFIDFVDVASPRSNIDADWNEIFELEEVNINFIRT